MEGRHVGETILESPGLLVRLPGGKLLASGVSHVCNPPLMPIVGIVLAGYSLSTRIAWFWAGIYGLLAVLTPALYVFWLFRQGVVSDLHLTIREERTRPLLITMGAALVAWIILYSAGAPHLLISL